MAVLMAREVPGRRLLVVDEDMITRSVLQQAYRLRGHACSTAATSSAALAAVAADPPEVVILDWSFRDGSGVGLAGRMRHVCPHQLVIVVVSVLDEPDGFRAREAIDDYLVKPVTAEAVESSFEACLAARQS